MSAPRLAPRRARTVYALADAWLPAAEGRPGGGDVDLVPALEASLALASPAERRALARWLIGLEWIPRLTRAGRRGFSWLPREARARWLEAGSRCPLPAVRAATARWRSLVESAFAATVPHRSPPGT
jgi:hypothetical protein